MSDDHEALRWIIYGLVVLLYGVGADLLLSLRKVEKVKKESGALTKDERVRLIARALKDCGQPVTPEAVAKQYRYETGETLGEEVPHDRAE